MKPMLAYQKTPPLDQLRYPLYASPKIDGIRCLTLEQGAVSRSLKPIPNNHIRNTLRELGVDGFDGELCVEGDFNSVQSAVMSVHGEPKFTYNVFDIAYGAKYSFADRLDMLAKDYYRLSDKAKEIVKLVPQLLITSSHNLDIYWTICETDGYEGVITKAPEKSYKYGRSTLNEQGSVKLIRWHRAEATIVGMEELYHNNNEAEINALGNQVRSHKLEGQVAGDTLGALVCVMNTVDGAVEFKVGSGFDAAQRLTIWNRDVIGKTITFKYKELSKYGVPRHPIFVGFRHKDDM